MTSKPVSKDPQKEEKKWSAFRKKLMERKDWEKELEKDFPNIKLPDWGCQCDQGWDNLIRVLFSQLSEYVDAHDIEYIQISQLKQKLAGLRCYIKDTNDKIESIVRIYEMMSYNICEVCGRPGEIHCKVSWIKTLCDKCAEEKGYEEKVSRRIITG